MGNILFHWVADIKREGTDVTIVSFGKIIKEAHIAAEVSKEGISCEIIDLRTYVLDYDTILTSVKKTNRLVVLEEAWPFASVASEITYIVQERAFFLMHQFKNYNCWHTSTLFSSIVERMVADDVIKAVKKMYINNIINMLWKLHHRSFDEVFFK
jgi:pyruvate dehydrogenase E1 component beta subunit